MRAAGVLAAALLAGCGSTASTGPLLTVDAYLAQCKALVAKPVQVAGYLGTCEGRSCLLFGDRAGGAEMEAYYRAVISNSPSGAAAIPRPSKAALTVISVGTGEASMRFDMKAAPFQHHYAVISGYPDGRDCTGQTGRDRYPALDPADIRAWTTAEGAPTNTQ